MEEIRLDSSPAQPLTADVDDEGDDAPVSIHEPADDAADEGDASANSGATHARATRNSQAIDSENRALPGNPQNMKRDSRSCRPVNAAKPSNG